MSRRLGLCLVLALLSMSVAVASVEAAPIRVTVVGDRHAYPAAPENSVVHDGIMSQTILPDDFPIHGYGLDWATSYSSFYSGGGHAGLTFIFDRLADGPPAAGSPSVTMRAVLDGQILWSPRGGYPYGQLSLKSIETSLANWSAGSDIPRSVIDTFLNPPDPSMTAIGLNGVVLVSLSLHPVPEPTTYALWGLVGLGALAVRRRRLSQRRRHLGDSLPLSPSAR